MQSSMRKRVAWLKIGVEDAWFYIENSYTSNKPLDMDKVFDVKFDLNKENSNGLGLYIVSNLLNNYKIGHKVLQGQSTFAFKIDLANRQNME